MQVTNTLEGTYSRLDDAEERINVKIIQSEQLKEKRNKRNEDRLKNLWDNICIIGSQKQERERNVTENIFEEILAENFSNLVKKTDI